MKMHFKPSRFPSVEVIPSANDEHLVDADEIDMTDYLGDVEDFIEESDMDLEEIFLGGLL